MTMKLIAWELQITAIYLWYPTAASTVTYGTANSVNEYPTVGGTTYGYNGNACISSNGTWTYTYDTENHLTAASETGTSVSYVYDGLHRQAQKTVGTVETRYIYSGWQRVADYNGSTGALQNRYIYGPGLDEPLMQVTSAGILTFYHADHQGSIIAVSNSSGAVANKNTYGPFGEGTPGAGTSFGFTGQRYDPETGLYYFKRRYYNPAIGRFLQPDTIGYGSRDLNLYSYARNNALIYTDPLGEISLVTGILIGIGVLALIVLIGAVYYWLFVDPSYNVKIDPKTGGGVNSPTGVPPVSSPFPGNGADPSNPNNPGCGIGPSNPGNTADPSNPNNPGTGIGPSNPGNTADPGNPSNPGCGVSPSNPGNTADPSNPDNPGCGIGPSSPGNSIGPNNDNQGNSPNNVPSNNGPNNNCS
jgi:RHS repeat-associated protein